MLAPRSGGKDSEADKRRCDGGWAQLRELLASFLDFFSAFFSFGVLVGFFLVSFLASVPLLMTFSPRDLA
jgi:hypothetical protein